jgi:predicted nuclease with TOPRIM domain
MTDTPRTDASRLAEAEELIRRGHDGWQKAEAEVKEIRNALGDDGRRTHKEILEMAFKASGWKTWKEKYIELKNAHMAEGQDPAGTIWEHADKLQKDLKASKAEVERLRDVFSRLTDEIECLPWCNSHQADHCDCGRLKRAYAISHSIAQNPTK